MTRAPQPPAATADALARRILTSPKYRTLDPEFVRRVAAEAGARFRDRNQALRYAKRKLHQAFGAFVRGAPAQAVAAAVDSVRSGRADLPAAALAAMRTHASAAERADWLVPFYERVAAWCGEPGSVADLACGLNPLAVPWMRLAPDATYWCCEVDADLVASLATLDQVLPVRLTSATCDLVATPPAVRTELALLLQTVATLEQQRTGAARAVLDRLDCRHVVVSLARRSLTGRRGYRDDPRALLETVLAGERYRWSDEAAFGDELVCHLTRRDR